MEERDLQRLERMIDESESVVVPSTLLAELLESAQAYAEAETEKITAAGRPAPKYAVGEQVRIDPQHCGALAAKGLVTNVWRGHNGQEDVYEVLLNYGSMRMLYRESELYPKMEE